METLIYLDIQDIHPLGMANLVPRGMVGSIYKGDYETFLHALGLIVSEEEYLFYVFSIVSLWAQITHGV